MVVFTKGMFCAVLILFILAISLEGIIAIASSQGKFCFKHLSWLNVLEICQILIIVFSMFMTPLPDIKSPGAFGLRLLLNYATRTIEYTIFFWIFAAFVTGVGYLIHKINHHAKHEENLDVKLTEKKESKK